ncbi:MAG TPA: hypothetical protein VGV61_14775 [Thermoanaerobaculia bacterium]|nr:hypothetical protein [Thermoanaerobaculia bacterium]
MRPRAGGPAAPLAGTAPWELPAGVVPSQRLFQGAYEGPEGGGSFRATLRLAALDRFRLDASDRLGRLLWTIAVDGSRTWWIDHRAGVWCPDLSQLALPGLGAGPVPATALPAILLGAVPAKPTGPPGPKGDLELRDDAGRRWTAVVDGGRLSTWTIWEGDQPLWWWRRQGRGGILSQRQGRQLRWQEVVGEPLPGELGPPAIPTGYVEDCSGPPVR